MDKINQIWPKWHTVELIGRGAFGEVYKARRELLGETFFSAVKVIRIPREEGEIRELLSDGHTSQSIQSYYESIARGLMNEIKLLETLKSAENVVTIEEFEVQERTDSIGWEAYIRMELLKNLDEYRAGRRLTEEEVVKLGSDICQALICCQKNRIIHRDIKPSNIFVDEYGHFKLGDFGVARQMERTQGTLSQKGTASYMAPELKEGGNQGSYNVDIYSLGLVMYRLLNRNKLPFEPQEKEICSAREREEAMLRRLQGEPLPLPVQADPQLGMIIRKACEYNREKRYQTALEMREDLQKWLQGRKQGDGNEEKEPPFRNNFSQDTVSGETAEKKFSDDEKTVSAFEKGSLKRETANTGYPQKGRDITLTQWIKPGQKDFTVMLQGGNSLLVKVPENAKNWETIRLKERGEPGKNGGLSGDLFIVLRMEETVQTEKTEAPTQKTSEKIRQEGEADRSPMPRRGRDVYITKHVEQGQDQVTVTLENGEKRIVDIPWPSYDGRRIFLKGKGLPGVNGGAPGDLTVVLRIPQTEDSKDPQSKNGRRRGPVPKVTILLLLTLAVIAVIFLADQGDLIQEQQGLVSLWMRRDNSVSSSAVEETVEDLLNEEEKELLSWIQEGIDAYNQTDIREMEISRKSLSADGSISEEYSDRLALDSSVQRIMEQRSYGVCYYTVEDGQEYYYTDTWGDPDGSGESRDYIARIPVDESVPEYDSYSYFKENQLQVKTPVELQDTVLDISISQESAGDGEIVITIESKVREDIPETLEEAMAQMGVPDSLMTKGLAGEWENMEVYYETMKKAYMGISCEIKYWLTAEGHQLLRDSVRQESLLSDEYVEDVANAYYNVLYDILYEQDLEMGLSQEEAEQNVEEYITEQNMEEGNLGGFGIGIIDETVYLTGDACQEIELPAEYYDVTYSQVYG